MTTPHTPLRHVLIVTVGQTAEPIELSITHHAPDGVIFLASQTSHIVAARLIDSFQGDFWHHTLLLNDPENLQESYRQASAALKLALAQDAQVISADITGGTKPMVAGVVLALSGRGVTLSYIGGTDRDAFGRVKSGHEAMRVLEDPTIRFHLREWEALTQAWNAQRFTEALAAVERITARPLSRSETHFFGHLRGVIVALDAWDSFQHRQALTLLAEHLEAALMVAELWRHGSKVRVLSGLQTQKSWLEELVTAGMTPNHRLLADLLANAERRAATGRFDDAVARLYRAIELLVEADLFSRHGINLKDPSTHSALSAALQKRAKEGLGLKETLSLAFDIDLFFGKQGTLAQRVFGDYPTTLRPLLASRHESILAHGLRPVEQETYTALRSYLTDLGVQAAEPWPKW
jgi:CRISPR-associated protein (TIGR02710 family)